MRRLMTVLAAAALSTATPAIAQDKTPPLTVSAGGRYLEAGGKPFFWLGDTGWLLLAKLDREETERYFAKREAQGYTKVEDLEFKDGMWKADATSANGKRVDVRLDPRTGNVYPDKPVSALGEADIRAQLSAAGYSGVHDVKLDDGLWKAKGTTAAGEKVKVRLDPTTGEVIALEKD